MNAGPVVATAALVLAAAAAARGTWSPCGLSMISAINPFSERSRGHRYWVTVLWFSAGAVAGGALLGAIGALGALAVHAAALPTALACAVSAACCLLAAGGDTDALPIRLPLIPRQVNERWLAGYRRWFYATGFGAQIGFGLATYVMTAAVYLVPVLGALSGSPVLALSAGLLFGAVRGLAILLTATVRSPAQLRGLHRRLAGWATNSLRVVLLLELGALALAVVVGVPAAVAAAAAVVVVAVAGNRRVEVGRPSESTAAGR
jgi:hypothetical protein